MIEAALILVLVFVFFHLLKESLKKAMPSPQKYNAYTPCHKCGSREVAIAVYHLSCALYKRRHVHRTCKRCVFEWIETPIK